MILKHRSAIVPIVGNRSAIVPIVKFSNTINMLSLYSYESLGNHELLS